MIVRFCLYGFLKNQRYFEPFLVLVLLDKGLDFLDVGLLVATRELVVNLLEVPSGAVADLWGRRSSLMLAFVAYLVSFGTFHGADSFPWLVLAMALYGVGDAFRSGSHKAILFDWLAAQGRQGEKARVYGLTRSWSQLGSAVSVVIATAIVLGDGSYRRIFLLSMLPYTLALVNFLGYPAEPERGASPSLSRVAQHLVATFRQCLRVPPLRRLLAESMLQRGAYTLSKDYLQPVVERYALALPLLIPAAVVLGAGGASGASPEGLDPIQQTALWVGAVSFALYLLASLATRQAHRVEGWVGGPTRTARALWLANLGLFGVLALGLGPLATMTPELPSTVTTLLVIAAFVGVAVVQNLWKPLFLARVDEASDAALGATILSIDSQAKALFMMVAAPTLGWAVDSWGLAAVGCFGVFLALIGLATLGGESRCPRGSHGHPETNQPGL